MEFIGISIQRINPSSDSLSVFGLDFVSIMVVKASIISDTFILIISLLFISCDAYMLPLKLIEDYCAMGT